MLIFRRPRFRAVAGPLAVLALILAVAGVTGTTSAAASPAASRPVAGKAPLKDLIGQPVRHVTPPASTGQSPEQLPRQSARAKLPAGDTAACLAPSRAGQAQCLAISNTIVSAKAKSGTAKAGTATKAGANAAAAATPSGYSPAQLQSAYNLTTASATGGTSGGTPEVIAVIDSYDDATAAADLAAYRTQFGLAPCVTGTGVGCLVKVNENNQTSPLPSAPPASAGDWTLQESANIDAITAICPNCEILLVEANSTSDTDLGQAAITAENDSDFVTGGWGESEFPGETADDQLYLNAPGKALVFPGGDTGYGTDWPAASQYVTSVGGTTLTADATVSRGYDETAWSGTGSGCTIFEPKPSWQKSDDTSPTGCLNRTQNDVAAVGDPSTGVAVYDSTASASGDNRTAGWDDVGSTSIAASIVTAAYALNGLPRAGTYPASYPYQSGNSSDFNAVTSGSNGTCESNRAYLCHGQSGFNGPAGQGTLNGAAGLAYSGNGDTVTVPNPGNNAMGWSQVSLRIPLQASDSDASQAITWSAAGLPERLTINSATGVISGDLSAFDAGTDNKVTATATDASGASGSVTFDLSVLTPLRTNWINHPGPFASGVSGMCIDDPSGNTAAGTVIHVYACNGGTNQTWSYFPPDTPGSAGNGGEIVSNLNTGMCVAVPGTNSGSKATLQACDRTDQKQEWNLQSGGELYNPLSGRCLSDPGNSTANNTQLDIENCAGATGQQWNLPAGQVLSGVNGDCMDDYQASAANNTKVDLYTCNGSTSQNWTVNPNGTIQIQGVCLDMQGQSKLDGGLAELYACNGGVNQKWTILPDGELMNVNSGKCLDDPANAATLGTQLEQEDCYRQAGEIWEPAP